MRIVCISRSALSGGEELARALAAKLGFPCLSREELVKAATEAGIKVGKLEMAAVKPRDWGERLAREREHYLAFTSSYLCDRALEGGLVYHGRTGHLLLSGIGHVLRVRVTSSHDLRVRNAMRALNLDHDKARRYVEDVDEDWRRWAHTLYGRSWEDVLEYDVTVNLEKVNPDNAAAALLAMSELPDFQMTPASLRALQDLRIGSLARLALARDPRVSCTRLRVRANDGIVTVSYLPQEWRCAGLIPDVLEGLDGIREVRTTMAATNILWVQERFDPASESFREVVEIATKWNAAVEPVRLVSGGGAEAAAGEETADEAAGLACVPARPEYDGGVEDDDGEAPAGDDGGLRRTVDELARLGRSGGGRVVRGGGEALVASIDRLSRYTLAVIGEVQLGKGKPARQRFTRELQALLADRLKTPVVTADELKGRYLFSGREAVRAGGYLALVAAVFLLVFTHQLPVLRFLAGDWGSGSTTDRVLVSVAVFLLVPMFAHAYGNVSKALLKLIKME